MERMRQDIMLLSSPNPPCIPFRPDFATKILNTGDWPKYKRASALMGHAFETYIAYMFRGRKFGGKVPLATEPDIIVPTI
jgi:hypothetical protein